MKKSDTEMISAFLDDELSEEERRDVKERLVKDEAFAKCFAEFNAGDQALKQTFSVIDDTPIPDSILSLLRESEKKVPVNTNNVLSFKRWQQAKWLPIAASFLIIVLALPVLLTMNQPSGLTVASVLDTQVSGQIIEISASTEVELLMSFNDNQGNFCREYVFSQSAQTEQRIACKVDGVWQTQISDSVVGVSGNNYQAASAGGSDKIEGWLDANMVGIPFSTKMEQENLNRLD